MYARRMAGGMAQIMASRASRDQNTRSFLYLHLSRSIYAIIHPRTQKEIRERLIR